MAFTGSSQEPPFDEAYLPTYLLTDSILEIRPNYFFVLVDVVPRK
jgi:hypothetical protein